jgi:hypothetical protein
MKRILTGSRAFFSDIDGFTPHDRDEVCICEEGEHPGFLVKRFFHTKDGNCEFHIVRVPKERLIKWEVRRGQAMSLGHYLLPEFCREFGITLNDFEQLRPLRDRLDYLHKYVGMIYDYYLENEAMTLTDEQRMAVYDEYKKERNI